MNRISLQDFILNSNVNNSNRINNIFNIINDYSNEFINTINFDGYGLVLTPGFFRFYCLFGFIYSLNELNLLKVTHCSGSSAGALVTGVLAAGNFLII